MKLARLSVVAAILLATILATRQGIAQDYRFATPEMDLEAFIEADASVRLKYKITFQNQPGARAIDIVDIGLPRSDYDFSTMSASLDGNKLRTIRKSEYIDIGVEVPLKPWAIQPGRSGTFEFAGRVPDMVYRDTTDHDYASLQIKPTWFDPNSQVGTTRLRIVIHLPPGIDKDEVRYQSEKLKYYDLATAGEGDQKHVVARWLFANHRLDSRNPKIAVSFPSRVMKRVVKIGPFGLFVRWFTERPGLQVGSGIVLLLCLGFLFFRFSGGTGFVVFLLLAGLLIFMMVKSPGLHLAAWPTMLLLIGGNEWVRHRKGKRYLPAMATIEGGGIKRGLTAPQAAVLLELPLSRVLTLVIFGLMKKGIAKAIQTEPLAVEVDPQFRTSRKNRRKKAGELGIVMHDYEQPFVDLLLAKDKTVEQIDFNEPLGRLIKTTAGLMKGFDLAETQEYHRRIIARAWSEAARIGELKQRSAVVDRNIEWMLLDPDAAGRFGRWHGGGYHYWPSWAGQTTSGHSGGSAAAPSTPTETSLGEVASSFAGWTENTSGQLASAIDPGSLGFDTPSMGLLDLSAVDHVTADVFQGLAEGGGGGAGEAAVRVRVAHVHVPAPGAADERMTGHPPAADSPRPNLPSQRLAEAQSQWLQNARSRLLRRAGITRRRSIVDLGCGWGQVSAELAKRSGGHVFAVDRDVTQKGSGLFYQNGDQGVSQEKRVVTPLVGDAYRLPLVDDSCDLVFCQCMLMWADDPRGVVQEALRVLEPGGAFAAIEPDYGGLMEYPEELALKPVWISALRRAGADPFIGRKLPHLLNELGCPAEVQFFDRLAPASEARFDLLLELPLTPTERQQVECARDGSLSADSAAVAHLPFWMVYSGV